MQAFQHSARLRNRATLIFVTLFVSYAYFYSGSDWNQGSHSDLTQALLFQHTVCIDKYHANTGDKSFFAGHYYSDKAPGLSFAALVPLYIADRVGHAVHVSPAWFAHFSLYICTVMTSAVSTALAATLIFLMLLRWGLRLSAATLSAMVFGLGTPMWVYATHFWGHALSAACLVCAFAAADGAREPATNSRRVMIGILVGATAGWAVVTEYPAAIPALLLAVLATISFRHSATDQKAWAWPAMALAASAGVCLIILLTYQNAAFGSPFRLGYSYTVNFGETVRQGAWGITYPKWEAFKKLLLGRRCGVLLFSPVLIAVPLGFATLWKQRTLRWSALTAAAIFLYYLLFNASYVSWAGGSSFGARYLSPGFPFACLLLAPAWEHAGKATKAILGISAFLGFAISLSGVAATPLVDAEVLSPIRFSFAQLLGGHLYESGGATNFGRVLSLTGLISLLPLVAIWAIAIVVWLRLPKPLPASVHPSPASGQNG